MSCNKKILKVFAFIVGIRLCTFSLVSPLNFYIKRYSSFSNPGVWIIDHLCPSPIGKLSPVKPQFNFTKAREALEVQDPHATEN